MSDSRQILHPHQHLSTVRISQLSAPSSCYTAAIALQLVPCWVWLAILSSRTLNQRVREQLSFR
ncbi:MAG: hypothetical protein HC862_16480 [Scytonema sp. RU_4_4]|nr:hypothetical protein [Scytonema sp. RU_4_4]